MTSEVFNKHLQHMQAVTVDTLTSKAKEYAADNDRLHNFKVAAAVQGISSLAAMSATSFAICRATLTLCALAALYCVSSFARSAFGLFAIRIPPLSCFPIIGPTYIAECSPGAIAGIALKDREAVRNDPMNVLRVVPAVHPAAPLIRAEGDILTGHYAPSSCSSAQSRNR